MAHDEVDHSLIINNYHKCKLQSYATNSNNISADKDEIVTKNECLSNSWAMNSFNILKFSKNNILKNPIVSLSLILLKKTKKQYLQLLPTSIQILLQTRRWMMVHKNVTKNPRTFLSNLMKMTIWCHLPKKKKKPWSSMTSTLHLMNKLIKAY